MRYVRIVAWGLVWASLAGFGAAHAQVEQSGGRGPTCDLKPGHYLINSAAVYLKTADETKFADVRDRNLRDANRVLMQALSNPDQQKNPAAWYNLGRYYVAMKDVAGADSAFRKVAEMAPQCKKDIDAWRRTAWVPVINAGIA